MVSILVIPVLEEISTTYHITAITGVIIARSTLINVNKRSFTMALNAGNENEKKTGSVESGFSGDNKAAQHTPQPRRAPSMWDHISSSQMFGAALPRTMGSDIILKLEKGLAECYQSINPDVEIKLIKLDRAEEPALDFSSLIVAMTPKDSVVKLVAFYIMQIEGTGNPVQPLRETINNAPVEIMRTAGDAVDSVVHKKVIARLEIIYKGYNQYFVGDCVIPTIFNAEDKTALFNVAFNASAAVMTELSLREEGFRDLNLAEMPRDLALSVNVGFSREVAHDATGLPIRRDIGLSFGSKRDGAGARSNTMNSGDRESEISLTSSFIDFVWGGQNRSAFNAYVAPGQIPQTQTHYARAVITDIYSQQSYSPAALMLALANTFNALNNQIWMQTFRPSMNTGSMSTMSDIGHLNYEANFAADPSGFGEKIDTTLHSFTLEHLATFLGTVVHPGLLVSMDCPEHGAQSWYTKMFAYAAQGNQDANNEIIHACNVLTGNAFSKYFTANMQIFADRDNRIHMGYWTDTNGVRRDIREIDTLAVAAMFGKTNPGVMRSWSDTFLRTNIPLEARLAERKRIIDQIATNVVYTGFSTRVTFDAGFMVAFANSIRDTGFATTVVTPMSGSDFQNQRASYAGAGALLMPGAPSFTAQGFHQHVGNRFAQGQYYTPRF